MIKYILSLLILYFVMTNYAYKCITRYTYNGVQNEFMNEYDKLGDIIQYAYNIEKMLINHLDHINTSYIFNNMISNMTNDQIYSSGISDDLNIFINKYEIKFKKNENDNFLVRLRYGQNVLSYKNDYPEYNIGSTIDECYYLDNLFRHYFTSNNIQYDHYGLFTNNITSLFNIDINSTLLQHYEILYSM